MSQELADELEHMVEGAVDDLRRLTPAEVVARSSPEKWSKQEVLGHLIDAAANNHQRFVRAQHTAELTFPPYDQNAWVGCQRYNQCDWNGLVDLWIAYNRHLVHVIANIPAEKMTTPCWVDWYDTPKAIPLRSMIEEYIGHMRHHLEQIRVYE
jgi:hypothetical protein